MCVCVLFALVALVSQYLKYLFSSTCCLLTYFAPTFMTMELLKINVFGS